jgi:hypothetical protein
MAHGTLQILQLDVHERREVQQSLLNDEGLKTMQCWPSLSHMRER